MSAQTLKAGQSGPLLTKISRAIADKDSATVTVEGPLSALKIVNVNYYCPAGLTVERSQLEPVGGGFGRLSIYCIKYESGSSFSAERTTFRIDMSEVQYDLEDHPYLAGSRDTILKWLATDEAKRVKGGKYYYTDEGGNESEIADETAEKFCKAYMAGIKTFNRYYPVIEKISIWKNPPGMNVSGRSFTGGSPTFSNNAGKYDSPPLSLNGFPSTNWFKSKDSWAQNEDRCWTRTEQWTYTPESSSGDHAWIYNEL